METSEAGRDDQPGEPRLTGNSKDFYDTNEFTTFAVGTQKVYFNSQTNKDLQFTNLTQTKRIPSYAKLKLQRLGVHVRQWDITARPSPEDVVCLYEMSSLRFTLG